MGEENHKRMLPVVFNSIISSHKILWFSLEITLACHSCRGRSTAEWKRERKDEMITVLPYAIGQDQTKSIYIWRWRWFISHFSAMWLGEVKQQESRKLQLCSASATVFWTRRFPTLLQSLWNWMCFPVPSIHLVPFLRAQVRWRKHCASTATAGSLVSGPIIMPISASYAKPFQQPRSQRPQLMPPDFSFNSSHTIRKLCVFLHLCIMMVI